LGIAAIVHRPAWHNRAMPSNTYVKVTGEKQGFIKGSVTQKGREGLIQVYGLSHEIVSPRDSASGLATGKRVHRPLSIQKEIDRSTPQLYTALCTNEQVKTVTITMYRASPTGAESVYYTVELTGATIVSIESSVADSRDPTAAAMPTTEEVTFTYQSIKWIWADGAITAQDDWISPA
jgi:type VI secretion system secreted protein Hcp